MRCVPPDDSSMTTTTTMTTIVFVIVFVAIVARQEEVIAQRTNVDERLHDGVDVIGTSADVVQSDVSR